MEGDRAGLANPYCHASQQSEMKDVTPNLSVNADVPDTFAVMADRGGGTPVTLYC